MSISGPSGRRPSRLAWIAAAALAVAGHAVADGPAARLGAAQIPLLKAALAAQVAASAEMANESARIALVGAPVPSSAGEGRVFLSLFTVRYRRLANGYCRLAVADPALRAVGLVPLPPNALYDSCAWVHPAYFLDVNGDGRLDVVHGAAIRSNAGSFSVTEAVVYLSSPAAPSGYCYSAQASAQLTPASLASAAAVAARLEAAKQRLGVAEFDCSR